MPTTTTYAVGYTGYAKIAGTQVFATGGSLTINLNPMYSSGVWGASGTAVTSKYVYAPGVATLDATVSYQLDETFKDNLDNIATSRPTSGAETAQNKGIDIVIWPSSLGGYSGKGGCTSISLNASLDSLVTGDVGVKAYVGGSSTEVDASKSNLSNRVLVPYYSTYAKITSTSGTGTTIAGECLGWSASYSSEINFVKVCKQTSSTRGSTSGTTITPDYMTYGNMQGSGTVNVIGTHVSVDSGEVKVTGYFQCPRAIIETKSISIQNGAQLAQTDYNFSALVNVNPAGTYGPPITFGESSNSNTGA